MSDITISDLYNRLRDFIDRDEVEIYDNGDEAVWQELEEIDNLAIKLGLHQAEEEG